MRRPPTGGQSAAVRAAVQRHYFQQPRQSWVSRVRPFVPSDEQVARLLEPLDDAARDVLVEQGRQIAALLDETKSIEEQVAELRAVWEDRFGAAVEPLIAPVRDVAAEISRSVAADDGPSDQQDEAPPLTPAVARGFTAVAVILIASAIGGGVIADKVYQRQFAEALGVFLVLLLGLYPIIKDL